jgi:rod shape determining protein RodA
MILVLADFFTAIVPNHDLRWVLRSLVPTVFMVVSIFLQPNLSTSITVMVIWFALVWASGLQVKHLALFIAIGITVAAIGFPFLEEYQQQRVFTFVFPNPDETFGNNYNVTQALIRSARAAGSARGTARAARCSCAFSRCDIRTSFFQPFPMNSASSAR